MKNVGLKIEGDVLTITVDLKKEYGLSKGGTGSNIIIASTDGNVSLPERDEKIGLNIYKKKAE